MRAKTENQIPWLSVIPKEAVFVVLKALVILMAGTWVLSPALAGPWFGDDGLYLLDNLLLYDPHRAWIAWTQPGSFIEYYPIEQIVQWYQFQLWGLDTPFYYLVTNLVLHLASALLLWWFFHKLGLKYAWIGGLLFATYPLMVDTVGSACELKNTLSLPPFILAMGFFLNYEKERKPHWYVLTLALFLVAMLCKITMCFFPITMLLYAWWQRGRVTWADVKASIPFFLISLVLGYTSLKAGEIFAATIHYHSPGPIHLGDAIHRLALVGLTLAFYFGHSFFPLHPMPYYPLWNLYPLTPGFLIPWIGIAFVAIVCWVKRHDWGRPVIFALSFFVMGLAPFLGLKEVSYMCLLWVTDHFLYIPIIALFGLALAALQHIEEQLPRRFVPAGIAVVLAVLVLLGAETRSYAQLFANREQLWAYNLKYNPNIFILHFLYGGMLFGRADYVDSEAQLDEAIRINPTFPGAYFSRGMCLYSTGDIKGAINFFQQSVTVDPYFDSGRLDLAFMLSLSHRYPEAADNFRIYTQHKPSVAAAHMGLGQALAEQQRYPEALVEMEEAHRLSPGDGQITKLLNTLQTLVPAPAPAK